MKREEDDKDMVFRRLKLQGQPRRIMTRKQTQDEIICYQRNHFGVTKYVKVNLSRMNEKLFQEKLKQLMLIPKPKPPGRPARRRPMATSSTFNLERHLVVQPSSIHGFGLFTANQIRPREIIIDYNGEIISNEEALQREVSYGKDKTYFMALGDDDVIVDATVIGNCSKFINHSCEPNCVVRVVELDGQKRILICARKTICSWGEITVNYNFFSEEIVACSCQSPSCKGRINTWSNMKELKKRSRQAEENTQPLPAFEEASEQKQNEAPEDRGPMTTDEDGAKLRYDAMQFR